MRNLRFGTLLLLSGTLAVSAAPAFAQGRGWGQQKAEEHNHGRGKDDGQAFAGNRERGRDHDDDRYWRGDRDREIIVGYYRIHRSELPPGLAKRESLPPGLARQLRRNGHLPPGLQKRLVWFPADLERRLGPLPYGYRRCWVGDNVLVVNPKTYAILEIVHGISILAH